MRDLWNWVENKAFNPRNPKEQEKWLSCFHKFLSKIWGIEPDWSKPVKTKSYWCSDKVNGNQELKLDTVSLKPLRGSEIGFSYHINRSDDGFSIRLFYSRGCFQIDYAENYLYEFMNDLSPSIDVDEIEKEDIEEVIKKRINHPALHTHLKKKDGGDYYHHLRFGFATNNPFVILYQVAFQIIDYRNKDSEMKEIEVSRLAKILHSNRNEPEISAGILFPH